MRNREAGAEKKGEQNNTSRDRDKQEKIAIRIDRQKDGEAYM